jgi:transposase-like protein
LVKSRNYPRIPHASGGIQVNFCKNPHCANFGIPAPQTRGAVKGGNGVGSYALIGSTEQKRSLVCHICKKSTVLRSNKAIDDELPRFSLAAHRASSSGCPNEDCESFGISPVREASRYYQHGVTRAGVPRHRCKLCGSTFSSGAPIRTQRRPGLDAEVLKLLVNKVPMRRICEVLDINPGTLYSKIAVLGQRASELCASHEQHLSSQRGERLRRAYVSIDRQDYVLNWGTQLDRRNIKLGAIGAVENVTGYVLAMQLNFDSSVDAQDVEADAIMRGDYDMPPAYRHHARIWLRREYLKREDLAEVPPENLRDLGVDFKAPHSGVQVHLEYTQYALLFHLKKLLAGIERTRFFLDRDPGLDSACLAVFAQAVLNRSVDVFVVKTAKEMTVARKKQILARDARELERFRAAANLPDDSNLRHQWVVHQLAAHRAKDPHPEWFTYPMSDMADPDKAIKYLTDFGDYNLEHLSWLYMRASLRGIDKFFIQVRRRISILERPLITANNLNTRWHGYAAYSPQVVEHVLRIFRAYYNYCLVGDDGKTPAMRLGLVDHPTTPDEFCLPRSGVTERKYR